MSTYNYQHCKNYKEKQKLNNLEEYKLKQRLKNQKYYNKLKNANFNTNHFNNDNDVKPYVYPDSDNEDVKEVVNEVVINEVVKEDVKEVVKKDIKEDVKFITDLNILEIDDSGFIIYKPIPKRLNPVNTSYLQPQTIKLYFNCFKKAYFNYFQSHMEQLFQDELLNLLHNNPYNILYIQEKLDFLNNDLYLFIKSLNKNDIQFIYSIISRIDGFDSIICKLYPYILLNQIHYQNSRDNKIMDVQENLKYNRLSFIKSDVLRLLHLKNLDNREKLLFSLFMLFPVRRPIDYIRMFLIDSEPVFDDSILINERKNYYFNAKFYFYRTKNKEIQIFDVPNELDAIIKNYINLRINGPLLLDNFNKEYDNSTIRIHIMKVFKKIYDISFTGLELRHFYSTYINQLVKENKLSILEQIDISKKMNHSYEENKKYSYIIPS